MGMYVGRGRKARRCYGLDEIALVPGSVTINPNDVDIVWELRGRKFEIPIIAAAMDGVVDTKFAIEMSKMGGFAVLNLEGIQTRYRNPDDVYTRISESDNESTTQLLQEIYQKEIDENLIGERISEIKKSGAIAAVSTIPQNAEKFGKCPQVPSSDIFVVHST